MTVRLVVVLSLVADEQAAVLERLRAVEKRSRVVVSRLRGSSAERILPRDRGTGIGWSRLSDNGVDGRRIQELLGHSTLVTTQRYLNTDVLSVGTAMKKAMGW